MTLTELLTLMKENFPVLVTAIITFITSTAVSKINNKGKLEIQMIERLQTDIDRMQQKIDKQNQRLENQDAEIQKLKKGLNQRDIRITQLKQHIYDKLPPPPPEWIENNDL